MRFVGALLLLVGGYIAYWWGLMGHSPWDAGGALFSSAGAGASRGTAPAGIDVQGAINAARGQSSRGAGQILQPARPGSPLQPTVPGISLQGGGRNFGGLQGGAP